MAAAVACVLAFAVPASARAADPVLAAAGDIACAPGSAVTPVDCHQQATSNLIIAAGPSAVATVGDNQYESGLLTEFTGAGAFDATWGRLTPLLHPAPGNHEYTISPTADGYFRYFGGLAGPPTGGYYSYDVGAWHVVSLNSNCSDTGCSDLLHGAVSTAEVRWLQSDLDAHAGRCTLAYWHHPRFTSGPIGDSPGVGALWDQLYAHRADVTLAGHDHDYERFAPMNPAGSADAQGIREFVVGTGGQNHGGAATNFHPYSQVFDNTDFAVLMLTLHPASYDWALERDDGTVLDQGSGQCHAQPPIVTTGAASQVTTSSAAVAGTVDPNALSTSYQFGYGTTTAYGASSPTVSAGSGKGPVAASASLGGLSPATTYHYRLVAGNTAGTSYGPDQTFTTDAEPPAVTAPPPIPPPAPPPIPPPAPPARPPAGSTGSPAPAATSTSPSPSPSPSRTVVVGRLPRDGIAVTPAGVLRLPLACPAGGVGCRTTVTLSLPPSRGHRNGVTLARIRGLRLAPGARVSLQLRLQRARLLALERPHRRRLALRLRLDTVVAGIATARTIPVTVRLPARRR